MGRVTTEQTDSLGSIAGGSTPIGGFAEIFAESSLYKSVNSVVRREDHALLDQAYPYIDSKQNFSVLVHDDASGNIFYAIHFSKKLGLYLAGGQSSWYFTSLDGKNWVQGSASVAARKYVENSYGVVVAFDYGKYTEWTEDGLTWVSGTTLNQLTSFRDACYDKTLDLFFAVGDGTYFYKSSDGKSFNSTYWSNGTSDTYRVVSDGNGTVLAFDNEGDVYKYDVDNDSFVQVSVSPTGARIECVVYNHSDGHFYILEAEGFYKSLDGSGWESISSFGGGAESATVLPDGTIVAARSGSDGIISYTEDGGSSWVSFQTPISSTPYVIASDDKGSCFVGLDAGMIYNIGITTSAQIAIPGDTTETRLVRVK
tara:strand:- start:223 stop:1329 length:1107 start_codon:yes stop_codon:yes gene_type:complete